MAALRYPLSSIGTDTDYLKIGIVGYTPSGFNASGRSGVSTYSGTTTFEPNRANRVFNPKTSSETIILPIPSNIQDGNSVNFGPGSMDGLTAQAAGIALAAFKGNPDANVAEIFKTTFKSGLDLFTGNDTKDYFLRSLATAAANAPFGGNLTAAQLLARETGDILNPNMELLFEGVNLRSFKFSFKMTPRSQKEAKIIREIIYELKKKMSPAVGKDSSLYLETPNIFELSYMKGNVPHPYLHRFKQCALTDMSVNYTGEGVYATYADGSPISYIMDLGFKELEPIYAGDYPDKIPNDEIGVGY
jgi:hypothetical protein